MDEMNILLLGEGNLTFSYALIKKLSKSRYFRRNGEAKSDDHDGPTVGLTVTTFDTKEELEEKYPEVIPIFEYFDSKGRITITYQDAIDATMVHESFTTPFSLVYFNNPHVGVENFLLQRALLSHSFSSVGKLPSGELPQQFVLSLCDDQPTRWDLLRCAERNGYVCVFAVPFFGEEFKEYENKRHQSDTKFPFQIMTHFYFMKKGRWRHPAAAVKALCQRGSRRLEVGVRRHRRQ
ncbi:Domain of unknown function (DUF2431), putative [Angomonas deanei]|uniref:25S rRNA (uridine-N(3))-methyltransferase BMT5-like domain-containing protein n=1 Tax=Angomonas deanei TaxID=59799 RepID=A0A7G2CDU5_9TRYP|nr:Domain of unknown function (DUF2431), putative [Angomonas deanei]